MFKAKNLIAIFFVLFLLLNTTELYAAELDLPKNIITPDKYLLFSIKRLFEKGMIFIKFGNDSKADYYKDLTLERAGELEYVVENKFLGEIERASQRFAYQTGTLADFISQNKIDDQKNASIKDLFAKYKSFLANLRDKYPANSSYWLLIQQDIDSIDLNLAKMK